MVQCADEELRKQSWELFNRVLDLLNDQLRYQVCGRLPGWHAR
jgi:hypothetical protein